MVQNRTASRCSSEMAFSAIIVRQRAHTTHLKNLTNIMPCCTRPQLISLLTIGLFFVVRAGLGRPTVTQATPFALRPGQPTEIELVGDKLALPVQFSTSFPGQIEIVSQEAQPPPSSLHVARGCRNTGGRTDALYCGRTIRHDLVNGR